MDYYPTLEEHNKHLHIMLKVLRDNQPYAKLSKCAFNKKFISYLRHIVDHQGVHAKPEKLMTVAKWP